MDSSERAHVSVFLILSVFSVLLSGFASAAPTGFFVLTQSKDAINAYFDNGKLKQGVVDQINEQLNAAPKELLSVFGNNKINFAITLDDNSQMDYYAHTVNGKVAEIFQGKKNEADLEVRLNEATIDRIVLSKEPLNEFLNAVSSGEIKYIGLTPEGEAKGAVMNIATAIMNFLKGIVDFFSRFIK
ncbi:Uncharacterised protein [uncultured archaeon]|nr:Uncharacterised protein [uncultured archaeon]